MKKRSSPRRSTPERTCIVCRAKAPKSSLLRIAVSPAGAVVVDESGKGAGRGAYVCRRRDCLLHPSLPRRLEHALHARLAADETARLVARLAESAAPPEETPPARDGA
jgi:predicted RNA-binding protein YlxR (DUF448 family)